MSEGKPHPRYMPLRVRFRPAAEVQAERSEQGTQVQRTQNGSNGTVSAIEQLQHSIQPLAPTPVPGSYSDAGSERRARQVRELLRLCDLMRADLDLDDVLQQIASSIAGCTGFRALAINLLDDDGKWLSTVAVAGIVEEDRRLLFEHAFPVEALFGLMRPQFRISQSFFIPHEHTRLLPEARLVAIKSVELDGQERWQPGYWHAEDSLIVPLYSLREQKLLGCLLLDDPEDGRVPTTESIEVVELFANKAAMAIDNARLFREREEERKALDEAIAFLREDLELLREGDLRRHVRSTHKKLQPAADAINTMVDEVSGILRSMRMVVQAVDEYTHNVQRHIAQLVKDAEGQEQQVHGISHLVGDLATQMHELSQQMALLSGKASDAVDVTMRAQGTVDRAVEGMGNVREATMQSARTMKSLGESGQEINETILALTDLTTRMHLLALNAAIEATRAGEQGQGFAIIAQEIRALALQCSEAARKIGAYIRTIQHETRSVSESVEQSTQHVIVQTELVTQTSVELEAIGLVTDSFTRLIQTINEITESQGHSSQLAVSSISDLSRTRRDISGHMQEMQQSMIHLMELTNTLRSRMVAMHPRER